HAVHRVENAPRAVSRSALVGVERAAGAAAAARAAGSVRGSGGHPNCTFTQLPGVPLWLKVVSGCVGGLFLPQLLDRLEEEIVIVNNGHREDNGTWRRTAHRRRQTSPRKLHAGSTHPGMSVVWVCAVP